MIIGTGGPNDRAFIPLATRRGTLIPNERRRERASELMRAAVQIHGRSHPNARLRSATQLYNCMGLIFAARRTWIDPTYLNMILVEDEYRRLAGPSESQVGDVVVYRNTRDHSVNIERRVDTASWKITVISQWGADGEYLHLMEDVPEMLGRPVKYWTDWRLNL
jgi:hypothetical protein